MFCQFDQCLLVVASARKYLVGDHVDSMNNWRRASAHKSFPPNVGGVLEAFIGCVASTIGY